jgi:transposase
MAESIKVQKIERTVGLDVGDRWSQICVLDQESGEVVEEGRVRTTRQALRRWFGGPRMRVVLEVGCQSPWISRLLASLGHEVLVANARQVRLIHASGNKSDRVDAEALARLGRFDPKLLRAIEHRSEPVQVDRALLKARDVLVRSRARLIGHVRGMVKSLGGRVRRSSAECFAAHAAEDMPDALRPALNPILEQIVALTATIRSYDREIEQLAQDRYPETALLRQVDGVGPITSLAFVLKIENPRRFGRSRTLGPYLGLVPRRDQSGARDPQLRITKQGDPFVRRLLIQCARYILGPFGKDCALRRHGLRIAERGGPNAKKRAAVAVARKLAVLLLHLWRTAEVYEPLHGIAEPQQRAA